VVFAAGLALATPPVEYLAALITILGSSATPGAQLSAAVMFTIVAFTVVEVPLISYLSAPVKTLQLLQRLNDWVGGHRHALVTLVVGVGGVALILTGASKL
jgi:hypothetical protein